MTGAMVKLPLPVHPEPVPVRFQVPVTVLLFVVCVKVPINVSWFDPSPFDDPDWTVIWRFPVVIPFAVLVDVNVPAPVLP